MNIAVVGRCVGVNEQMNRKNEDQMGEALRPELQRNGGRKKVWIPQPAR